MSAPKYILVDGDEHARHHPGFEMPPLDARQRLRVGDVVKLIFVLPGKGVLPAPGYGGGERMWVRVDECLATIPRRYRGQLWAHPVTVPLKHGDTVHFGAEHVIDIDDRVTAPEGRAG